MSTSIKKTTAKTSAARQQTVSTSKPKATARVVNVPAAVSRTKATERYYIPGYPNKLYIYRQVASPYWWVRYFANNKPIRKTTKTASKQEAVRFAKDFYDVITHNLRHGVSATESATSFEAMCKQMLLADKGRMQRGELTKITYDNNTYRYNKSILPYFGRMEVRDVDYMTVNRYLNEISVQSLSSSTVSAYIRLVRRVLSYAARSRAIAHVPEMPVVKVTDNARGWFNTIEYRKLWSAAKRLVGQKIAIYKYSDDEGEVQTQYLLPDELGRARGKLMRNVLMTEDLWRLIVFMTNSYIRPTDIKFMKHKHVDIVRGDFVYLRLRIPPTKGHGTPITTMPKAVDTYEKLLAHHKATGLVGDDVKDDYVFLPQYKSNRDYALKQFQRQWDVLMWDTGLKQGANEEERSLYSLRHTCIMWRMIWGEGINTLALARNARTSVEMIDRFYAKPLTGEMNIEMLQSKRRRRHFFDGDTA